MGFISTHRFYLFLMLFLTLLGRTESGHGLLNCWLGLILTCNCYYLTLNSTDEKPIYVLYTTHSPGRSQIAAKLVKALKHRSPPRSRRGSWECLAGEEEAERRRP